MSIVACDGVLIASDARITDDGIDPFSVRPKFHAIKIRRKPAIVALVGGVGWCSAFAAWCQEGMRKGEMPTTPTDAPGSGTATVYLDGVWITYGSSYAHGEPNGPKWALGSGTPYARAALLLGHNAIEAARVAARLDPGCGEPIYSARIADLTAGRHDAISKTTGSRTARYTESPAGPANVTHSRNAKAHFKVRDDRTE